MSLIEELEKISDMDCTCTPEQVTGEDPSICPSCYAGNVLNDMDDWAREEFNYLKRELKNTVKCQNQIQVNQEKNL